MFDGTLGMWNTNMVGLKLNDDTKSFCLRPYTVRRVHKYILKNWTITSKNRRP